MNRPLLLLAIAAITLTGCGSADPAPSSSSDVDDITRETDEMIADTEKARGDLASTYDSAEECIADNSVTMVAACESVFDDAAELPAVETCRDFTSWETSKQRDYVVSAHGDDDTIMLTTSLIDVCREFPARALLGTLTALVSARERM